MYQFLIIAYLFTLVNSFLIAEKPKTGKLHVRLDPQALNMVIGRQHFPMRTLDDILPQLSDAKFFSMFDVRRGYWSIKLSKRLLPLSAVTVTCAFHLVLSVVKIYSNPRSKNRLKTLKVLPRYIPVYGSSNEQPDINLL